MIPDGGDGDSTTMTTPEEAKVIMSKERHKLVPQLRFAPGFHFLPTEFELLDVYLRGKIDGRKPPLDIFMDVNFLEIEPEKLMAERKAYGEDTYFFFTVRQEWPSNKNGQPRRKLRVERVNASWKATGSVVEIHHPGTGKVVGTRRMLTYSSSRRNEDKYSMYEYVLSESKMNQWVLCTIREKRLSANVGEDKNVSTVVKDKEASAVKDKKRKRGTETRVKPTTTTGKKKTATSQPQETQQQQQQQQQEIASGISFDPPPLLTDEQVHHQAFYEEDVMAFHETSPTIQVVGPYHEYPDGVQPYYLNSTVQEEAMTWDGHGTTPLMPFMTHHQQGYQASSMEEQRFDIVGAQYMSDHQFSTMAQFHQQYPMFQCEEQQQQQKQPHDTNELLSLVGRMERAPCEFLLQDQFRPQGFQGDITGALQDIPLFLHESGKPPPQTSPDSVLGGPDPLPPSGDAYPYYDSDAGMMNGIASTLNTQATPDHQFNPVGFPGHNFDGNLIKSNCGDSDVATGLPDHGSNQALHTCQHGFQWRCGGQQGVDMGSCFRCVTLCAQHHHSI